MVEITYQMVLSTLQTAGILVGIYYYVMTLRSQRKDRMIEMVFQRMQERGLEYQKMSRDIRPMMNGWETVEEFYEKYNYLKTPDLAVKRAHIITNLGFWGFLLREGLIEVDFIIRLHLPWYIIRMWESFEPLFLKQREIDPEAHKDFEYLYKAVKKKYPHISAKTRFTWEEARERSKEQRNSAFDETQ